MNIEEQVLKLKARAFDLINAREGLNRELQQVAQTIAALEQQQAKVAENGMAPAQVEAAG